MLESRYLTTVSSLPRQVATPTSNASTAVFCHRLLCVNRSTLDAAGRDQIVYLSKVRDEREDLRE